MLTKLTAGRWVRGSDDYSLFIFLKFFLVELGGYFLLGKCFMMSVGKWEKIK